MDCTISLLSVQKECIYTKCYCEENVWQLCNYIKKHAPQQLQSTFAVFISNEHRQIPLWQQKAGKDPPDFLVVWDYHVILVYQNAADHQPSLVYDLDSCLEFPCVFRDYATQTLRDDSFIRREYHRFFRVIPADVYLETFASDRSHMLSCDGSWTQPPPEYPCISTKASTNNIQDFISMQSDVGRGRVVDLGMFLHMFD